VLVRTLLSSNYVVDHRLNLCRLIVDELIRGARVRLVTGSTSRANSRPTARVASAFRGPFPGIVLLVLLAVGDRESEPALRRPRLLASPLPMT